ncbi:aar2 containing protein [Ophiocordyceps camponoti-floridani]|uniref:Aar2 containing protein n=1 Tax=Ophiocordyceps camponoti-floridani TaxID=2030778 RepID=A0A8H4Q915_9HYPO|nr:aar2 containing protein [Ophiocordyceps camponoti-floridani]
MPFPNPASIILIPNLPPNYTIGFDTLSFPARTFTGLRDVPPGTHFLWAAHPTALSRCGFWIVCEAEHGVHVVLWRTEEERFVGAGETEARLRAERLKDGLGGLLSFRDGGDGAVLWRQLTSGIDGSALDRILTAREDGWDVHSSDGVKVSLTDKHMDTKTSPSLSPSDHLNFTFQQGLRNISRGPRHAADTTPYVSTTLADSNHSVIADLQFAYIVGLYLENDACLQQWFFTLLRILLPAHTLITQRPALVTAVLDTLSAQLTHGHDFCEGSIFDYGQGLERDMRFALGGYGRSMREVAPGSAREESEMARADVVGRLLMSSAVWAGRESHGFVNSG